MKVEDDLSSNTINSEVKKSISKEAIVYTDTYKSYNKLPDVIENHYSYSLQYGNSNDMLP